VQNSVSGLSLQDIQAEVIDELLIIRTSLGRPKSRWVHKFKMNLVKIRRDGLDCIGLLQDRDKWRALVNAVMNIRDSFNCWKFWSGCTIGGHSPSIV
jgi:hypothetical protein